jgi:adenylate kinase family enzyme
MKRIAIIGISGSGKSTFANSLGNTLNRSIIYLDKEYWTNGWEKRYSSEDWKKFVKNLSQQDEWIIDGNYQSSMITRLDRADTIIFFDFSRWICFFRVLFRVLNRKQPFDKSEGTRERVSLELIKFIIKYPRKEILKKLESYKNTKEIFIVKNSKEVDELLIKMVKFEL